MVDVSNTDIGVRDAANVDPVYQLRQLATFLFIVASTMLVMFVESVAGYSIAKVIFFSVTAILLGGIISIQSVISVRYSSSFLATAICAIPYLLVCALKPGAFNPVASVVVVLIILFFANKFEFNRSFANLCILWLAGVLLFHTLYAVQIGVFRQFQSFYFQKNEFAGNVLASLFMFSYFLHMEFRQTGRLNAVAALSIGLCVTLLYISSSRGSMLTALVFGFLYLVWGWIEKSQLRSWLLFIGTIAITAMVIPAYLYLSTLSVAPELNKISQVWTGQLLFSGRNNQWPVFLYLIYLNPWKGYGFDNDFTQWLASVGGLAQQYASYSADNFYLTIALQTGFIGLGCVLFFLAMVWRLILSFKARDDIRIVAPMFIAYFVHEIFETSFVQGNLQVCVFLWLLVGVSTRSVASDSQWPQPMARRVAS